MDEINSLKLAKGSSFRLRDADGAPLDRIFIGCNWAAVPGSSFFGLFRHTIAVDLDLSCVMFNGSGELVDHIYSPLYREAILKKFGLPKGKLNSRNNALQHSGDDMKGDAAEDDAEVDNENIRVNLKDIDPEIARIYFFLNNAGKESFSKIPYTELRFSTENDEGERNYFATYEIKASSQLQHKTAIILGCLERLENGEWTFTVISEPTDDPFPGHTIHHIAEEFESNRK